MKKYKYILPLLFSAVMLFTACSEELLEIPQKGVVSIESFYQTDEDAESALVDTYHDFAQNIGGHDGIYVPYNIIFNYLADNVLSAGEFYGDNDRLVQSMSIVLIRKVRCYYNVQTFLLVIYMRPCNRQFRYGESR
jgi:hypothetical protein